MGLKKAGWDVVGRSLKMREAVQSSSAVGEYMSGYSIELILFFTLYKSLHSQVVVIT